MIVTLLACLCSHTRRRQKRENQKQKLGISRALACEHFQAPWVRKFGYLCIQEILVLTKIVRTYVRPAGVNFAKSEREHIVEFFSIKRVGRKFHVVVVENKAMCKKAVLHVQSCCFFLLIRPVVFCCSRCRRRLVLHDFVFCLSKVQVYYYRELRF